MIKLGELNRLFWMLGLGLLGFSIGRALFLVHALELEWYENLT